jgi:hypothetical protein
MKKLLSLVLALVLFSAIGLLTSTASAATNPDYAYVVVRCTVSLSVQVVSPNYYVYTSSQAGAGISASDIVVTSNVVVQNNGSGCIETWTLNVTSQDYSTSDNGPWIANALPAGAPWILSTNMANTLPSAAGVNQVVLGACFKSVAAVPGDYGPNGFNLLKWFNAQTWLSGGFDIAAGVFQPTSNAYPQDFVYGSGNNNISAGSSKNLYFYVKAPTAVTDTNFHRFTVTITAAVGL